MSLGHLFLPSVGEEVPKLDFGCDSNCSLLLEMMLATCTIRGRGPVPYPSICEELHSEVEPIKQGNDQ